MKIVKADIEGMEAAVKTLCAGGVAVIPTDTVYGLAAHPDFPAAVERLYTIKARDAKKPIALLASDAPAAAKFIGEDASKLGAKYWPGALTIVSQGEGVRIPDHDWTRELLRRCGGVLRVTSANMSGRRPATDAEASLADIGLSADLVVDDGVSPGGTASTVVKLEDGKISVLREGPVKVMKKFLTLLSIVVTTQVNAAEWIRPERVKLNATFVVAKEFACTKQVEKATLKTSAAGIGVWKINGEKVGDGFYEPEVSYYQKRIYFRKHDVTKMLRENNRVEAEVGGGWYDQNLVWACERWQGLNCSYGRPAAWAELKLEYGDGTSETIGTDATWKSGDGRSVWNNIYGGEIIDARGGNVADGKVVIAKDVVGRLDPSFVPPCRVLKTYSAKVRGAMGGRNDVWIYDFGTNLAGSVKFKLPPLVPGSRLKVRFAETLTKEGGLDPRSLGSFATHNSPEYVYIAPDEPQATEFVPEFSYTSFRYAEVSGYEPFPDVAKNWGKAPPDDLLTGVMIATDVKRIRRVEVESRSRTAEGISDSDVKLIERFVEIADHTILCNLHGIPEDCPGREKGGWLGDATVVCPYALAVWDLEDVYVKYMRDIADGTEIFGEIPCQVPTHRAFAWSAAPALWRCAAIGIPYQLYRQRGNEKVVRENWWLIEKCLDMFAKDAEKDGLVRWGYGDWIPPAGKDYKMPVEHSSNLVWIECLEQADRLAKELKIKTKRDCAAEAKRVREQFRNVFFDEKNGTFGYDGTDAVAFNLGIADTMPALLKRLADRDYMMTTGIYATPHLVRALKKVGRLDVMMKVLFNERHASYRTVIDEGFTTCPEDLADKLRVSREDEPQHSLSHPMHCGWIAELL